jgi:hypothetical protein
MRRRGTDRGRHHELVQRRGPDFDPDDPHTARIDAALVALAKRWNRTLSAKRKT